MLKPLPPTTTGALAVLPDGGGERREFVVKLFLLADQHVVNVAEQNADQVRLIIPASVSTNSVQPLGEPVQPSASRGPRGGARR